MIGSRTDDQSGSSPAAEEEPRSDQRTAPAARPPRKRVRFPWKVMVFLLLAAAAGSGAWYYLRQRQPDDKRLILQGNIDVRQVNLAFKVEGRIASLAVDEGDAVRAGQVLATLDKQYFLDELRLAQARRDNQASILERLVHGSRPEEIREAKAAVAERSATLENAVAALRRREALVAKGALTGEEFDNARTAVREAEAKLTTAKEALRLAEIGPRQEDIEAAKAQLRAEEASLSQAERRLADSDLIAPAAGEILTRARERGAIVAAGETVFALTLTSPVWVRTYVGELDLGRVRPDMPVLVRPDSPTDKSYTGHIGFISPTAEFTPKTVETRELRPDLVYRLRIVVENPDGKLRQGMPVTVIVDDDEGGSRER